MRQQIGEKRKVGAWLEKWKGMGNVLEIVIKWTQTQNHATLTIMSNDVFSSTGYKADL